MSTSAPKHYQVVMTEEEMLSLRKKSGKLNNKDALYEAVRHYLECEK